MPIETQIGNRVVTQKYVNDIAYAVVGCAIEVHEHLGPGLLESIYHSCLADEFSRVGLPLKSQVLVPLHYKERSLGPKLRLDFLVDDLVIVELKAVEAIIPLYKAQLLSYLRLTGKPKGLLINFNCEYIVKQLMPLVTDEFARLPIEWNLV